MTAQTADARQWGGELGPPTHAPPTIRCDGGARATSSGREGEGTSAGGNLLPRSPLTADRQPSRPPLAGQRRVATAGGTRDPSEGLHEGPAPGRGGWGKSATLQPTAGPPGRDLQAAPLGRQGAARGDQWAPPTPAPPPPLRPKSGRRRTEETAAPQPPRRGRYTRGEGALRPRQAPPVNRLHAPALPTADRRRTGGAQDGANGAALSEAGLGKAGARTRAGGVPPPSLPPPPH